VYVVFVSKQKTKKHQCPECHDADARPLFQGFVVFVNSKHKNELNAEVYAQ
jgi:RNA polymerase subunit RPABC4/transcription elongation factor Spt4